jgi:dTDP-4-amino-4,6-dideoxygalactose transaminase
VIEDGAQAIGAEYKGRRALSMGDIGCISFYPTKNLGGFGDGGMLVTRDRERAEELAMLRVHGSRVRYVHDRVGINSRLDTLQAAILRVKMNHLDAETDGRRKNAERYRKLLDGAPVQCASPAVYQTRHVYNQFVIRAPRRDGLKEWLRENGVGTEIYYPLPLHLQACFRHLGHREGDFPHSERAAREVLALPAHSAVSGDDIEYVCRLVRAFYA